MLVRIEGTYQGKDFVAGMDIKMPSVMPSPAMLADDVPHRIVSIASFLKRIFNHRSPITINNIRTRCEREQWKVEFIDCE